MWAQKGKTSVEWSLKDSLTLVQFEEFQLPPFSFFTLLTMWKLTETAKYYDSFIILFIITKLLDAIIAAKENNIVYIFSVSYYHQGKICERFPNNVFIDSMTKCFQMIFLPMFQCYKIHKPLFCTLWKCSNYLWKIIWLPRPIWL